ncbi:hypothetical protein QJS10_CPA05g01712 [Acorus calamus]|uniref:Uncharacterized protein n=1 Tax=Acorus calamus TaxID=4465 RepID=A0AAV9EVM0_ACOCL|nr:hypothetical protein QJS10_CPA05g01712 [Acorus calamus]
MNEPKCASDTSGFIHVKSIDNNHLLEIDLGGFHGVSLPRKIAASSSHPLPKNELYNSKLKMLEG